MFFFIYSINFVKPVFESKLSHANYQTTIVFFCIYHKHNMLTHITWNYKIYIFIYILYFVKLTSYYIGKDHSIFS